MTSRSHPHPCRRRRRSVAVLTALAALAAMAGSGAAAAATHPVSGSARIEPAVARFGDALTYVATVTIPGAGGEEAVVLGGVAPLSALGPATITRRAVGADTVVTLRQRVACLDHGCLPGRRRRGVRTSPILVRREAVTAAVPGSGAAVTITPRVPVSAVEVGRGGFRAVADVPAATTRLGGGTLVAALLALAAIGLLAAFAPVWPDARRRFARRRAAAGVDPFARALRLLRESAARAGADRRRAADLVGRVVSARGDSEQARRAATVAWSRTDPLPDDAVGLADAVTRAVSPVPRDLPATSVAGVQEGGGR
jgi:hypothetical protein